jgi:hypothetical protein
MFHNFDRTFSHKSPLPRKSGGTHGRAAAPPHAAGRKLTYTKVFRWQRPKGQTQKPASVEIVGTFTNWQKIPLVRDDALDSWQVTLHEIPGNRTHHYMLLVDGQPVQDKHCDGLAIPHGPQEQKFQLTTLRGPRVLMLFAQTK